MATPFSGGCVCGALRYECAAEPLSTFNCYCRDCQRASGSPFVSILTVPKDAVKIAGTAHYYDLKADSGNTISRAFCPICGARVFSKTSGNPQILALNAVCLDDPRWFRPEIDIYSGLRLHATNLQRFSLTRRASITISTNVYQIFVYSLI